jgi:hypothetical protein
MLESLFFIEGTKKASPIAKALHIISVTRLLAHVTLDIVVV